MTLTDSPFASRPWIRQYDPLVPAHIAVPQRPLHEILDATAREMPDSPATLFHGATLTYAEVARQSVRLAGALAARHVAKGDRVGVMLPNCPQYLIAVFAILRAGAVVVNINPAYTARELSAIFEDSGLRLLITLDNLAALVLEAGRATGMTQVVATSLAAYGKTGAATSTTQGAALLSDLLQEADQQRQDVDLGPDDLAVLQYTGGTTGGLKAAMLTHANLFANVLQASAFLDAGRPRGSARCLLVIPCFHTYGFTVGLLKSVWTGALLVLMPAYDVHEVLRLFRTVQPTFFPGVPTLFVSLLRHPDVSAYGLDQVVRFNSGGAPLPIELAEQWERTVGRPLYQGYGLSEASPVTHSTPQLGARRPGTVGVPLPDTDVKVVDLETGTREVAVGERGELCVAGPQVMRGYWRRPDETARVLRADEAGRPWLHTGDIASMDADGFTTILQRKTDLIIVDGLNVFPSEVESVLRAHPAVRLAAVIGSPDPYHGEVVRAFVVLRDGAMATPDDLEAHCRMSLAPHKVPSTIALRASLPTNAAGKLLYRELRGEGDAGELGDLAIG